MEFNAKSIIISRKKIVRYENYNCIISLFDVNEPHKGAKEPFNILEYEDVQKVMIKMLNIEYLLFGSDIMIDNLKKVKIEQKGKHLIISGDGKSSKTENLPI